MLIRFANANRNHLLQFLHHVKFNHVGSVKEHVQLSGLDEVGLARHSPAIEVREEEQ